MRKPRFHAGLRGVDIKRVEIIRAVFLTIINKKKIEATLSGTVTQSLTRYSGTQYNVSVPANQFMKLRFTPRVNEIKGTFVVEYAQVGGTITQLKTPVAAKFFIVKNNLPDGSYVPEFKNYGW